MAEQPQNQGQGQEQGQLKTREQGEVARRDEARARPMQRVTVPCDVYENDNEYLIVADMPGLSTEQCELMVRGNRLEIHGQRSIGDDLNVHYERSFTLPDNADTQGITASYRNGVVMVTVPKTQESRPRRIEVRSQ